MKLAFLGTPAMAVPFLHALVDAGHEVAVVVTGSDKRRGRGSTPGPTPVKAAALELGLPITHTIDAVVDSGVEMGVVVAFGRLIRPHVLAAVPMINSHFSLLPRWRGAAPVERAILAGDTETGVCLMKLEEGLDTGPVYDTVRVPIPPTATAAELRATLITVGVEQLVRCVRGPLPTPRAQQGDALYAAKIQPHELRIDWSQPADNVYRLIRVGGAWTTFRGKRVKVLAATFDGTNVQLVTVQPEGKVAMSLTDFERGVRRRPDESFE